jgi:hypothetical protein
MRYGGTIKISRIMGRYVNDGGEGSDKKDEATI